MSEHLSVVEQELIDTTKFTPEKKHKKRQVYLTDLLKTVNDLDDDTFGLLSDQAAEWFDRAVVAHKQKKEIPDFEQPKTNGKDKVSLNLIPESEAFEDHSDLEPVKMPEEEPQAEVSPDSPVTEEFADPSVDLVEQPVMFEEDAPHNYTSEVEPPAIEEIEKEVKKSRGARRAKASTTARAKKPKEEVKETVKEVAVKEEVKEEVKAPKTTRGVNKWGVAKGTKADAVCQLLARPEGATMKDIIELTGHTQYNLCNRLQRRGYNIKFEGKTIKLSD